MAGKALTTLIYIGRDLTVVFVHVGLVVLVAVETGEDRVVCRTRMTGLTGPPPTLVFPRVDREEVSVMVEMSPIPGGHLVAGDTGRWESRPAMLPLEVAKVTGHAIIWGGWVEQRSFAVRRVTTRAG